MVAEFGSNVDSAFKYKQHFYVFRALNAGVEEYLTGGEFHEGQAVVSCSSSLDFSPRPLNFGSATNSGNRSGGFLFALLDPTLRRLNIA